MNATLLLTNALHPPEGMPFLRMRDVAVRAVTAKASVFFWAACGVDRIVLADATQATLLNEHDLALLRDLRIDVEQIEYAQDDAAAKARGKGYAEGQLMRFACENSVLLRQSGGFFKCTGKVFCRNFKSIKAMIDSNRVRSIFFLERIDQRGVSRRHPFFLHLARVFQRPADPGLSRA